MKNHRQTITYLFSFFFNDTAPPEIYTLSLHDALPISRGAPHPRHTGEGDRRFFAEARKKHEDRKSTRSELQSRRDLVCRLLLEKKKLVLLLGIDCEIAFRCRLRRHANRNNGSHQRAIAFHYINVFLGKRDFHSHGRWIVRLIRGY